MPKKDIYNINLGKFSKNKYKAEIKIFIDNNLVQERTLNFIVLAINEKISKGILDLVINQDKAHIYDVVKINANFINTGESTLQPILKTEVYLNNDLIETLESNNKISVEPQNNITIENSFIPKSIGTFKFKNYVQYADKISNTRESILEVVPSSEPLKEIPLSASPMILILGMALIIFIFMRVNKARRKKWQKKQ